MGALKVVTVAVPTIFSVVYLILALLCFQSGSTHRGEYTKEKVVSGQGLVVLERAFALDRSVIEIFWPNYAAAVPGGTLTPNSIAENSPPYHLAGLMFVFAALCCLINAVILKSIMQTPASANKVHAASAPKAIVPELEISPWLLMREFMITVFLYAIVCSIALIAFFAFYGGLGAGTVWEGLNGQRAWMTGTGSAAREFYHYALSLLQPTVNGGDFE